MSQCWGPGSEDGQGSSVESCACGRYQRVGVRCWGK